MTLVRSGTKDMAERVKTLVGERRANKSKITELESMVKDLVSSITDANG